MLMYAVPLNVIAECVRRNAFRVPNKDLLRAMLINEGVSGSLQSYHELAQENGLSACGWLLLRRKRLCDIQIKKRILSERLERRRLGQLSLGGICTRGLPREDVDISLFLKSLKSLC